MIKVEVDNGVTLSIGNRNFFKRGYRLEREVPEEEVDQARKEMLALIDKWLKEDRDEALRAQVEIFEGFGKD